MILSEYIKHLDKLLRKNPDTYSRIAPTVLQVYELNGKHLATIEIDTFIKEIQYREGKIYGDKLKDTDIDRLNNTEIISLNAGCRFGNMEVYMKGNNKKII